jgi:hypothetical protein
MIGTVLNSSRRLLFKEGNPTMMTQLNARKSCLIQMYIKSNDYGLSDGVGAMQSSISWRLYE